MLFKENTALYSYEISRESGENVMYINYLGANFVPSLADYGEVMSRTIDVLNENQNVSRIVFVQQRNYSYDFQQVKMLSEIAYLYNLFTKQEKILSSEKLFFAKEQFPEIYNNLNYILNILFKQDIVRAYRELKNLLFQQKAIYEKSPTNEPYIKFLERMISLMDELTIIKKLKSIFSSYKVGDRKIYYEVFRADVIPNFTFTRMVSKVPDDAEIIEQYEIGKGYDKSSVTIFKDRNEPKLIYHLNPPEYLLTEEHNMLLNLARNVLIEHKPTSDEFNDAERTRQIFFNVARDLLQDLANNKNVKLNYSELGVLATILVRYTIGFGILEVLLQDEKLQDIVINSPVSLSRIFVRHNDFDECSTNLIPSQEDAESWAAKFRVSSGRALDEANPILDTNLVLNELKARVSIVQNPLSAGGLAYSLRRHRTKPWTLPLFMKNKMIDGLSAGLLSFLIDGSRTMLVAGTRSSGKTSLLGSLMLEIMPKYRIITIEDSVAGDSKIIIKENGEFKKTTIGQFIDEKIKKNGFKDINEREKASNLDNIEIFSVDKKGRVVLSKPSKFIRHKTNKQIYEIITTSGKKIKVTEDHSLFTLDEKNIIKPIKCNNLKEDSFIAIPLKLPFNNSINNINLLEHLNKIDKKLFIFGKGVEKYILENKKELLLLAYSLGYKKLRIQNWIKKKILPVKIFEEVKDKIDKDNLFVKSLSSSRKIPINISLDEDFLAFIGLWLADGCYDKNSVIISVQEEENKDIVRKVANKFNIPVKMHSDKFSSMLNSTLLKEVMQNVLELKGNSYTKNIPSWAYNLSNKQVGALLKGFFSGDGCASDKEILLSLRSRGLIEDVVTLLLRFDIVSRSSTSLSKGFYLKEKRDMFHCKIGSTKMINKFKKNVNFLVKSKQERLEKLCSRISTHDTSDIIPLSLEIKEELNKILGTKFNKHDYITRQNNIGREHLFNLIELIPNNINLVNSLKEILKSDIFWDKIKSIKKVESKGYVYDISVPEHENFICENIIAHNTLELPVEEIRKLNYDILSLKVRSALTEKTVEVSAEEGIRASLRLGDSSLIIGEIRSTEARALYEAMRVGALANVVAGTIHGASPYAVFDRVVNDLQVPVTSFKATDCIVVANPIKSPDGMHSWRRVLQISEVRKHWTKDPLDERGFVDLMQYDVSEDKLKPSEDLINGDSDIIKDIAANVKGWAGNWDAVWDNILLRQKIKEELVRHAEKTNNLKLLEAEFNVFSNNAFHQISDKVRQEIGLPTSERVFPEWKKWLEKESKRLGIE
ncbi:MAG: ATPase, T2SS/T4P/T4SS family [Nanoarchaeota archaeon]|nr:ATPase, T2SS/T4P/T4SS family [Nanoarchaeota archaeon]